MQLIVDPKQVVEIIDDFSLVLGFKDQLDIGFQLFERGGSIDVGLIGKSQKISRNKTDDPLLKLIVNAVSPHEFRYGLGR